VPFSQPFVPQAGGPAGPPEFNFQVRRSLRMHGKLALLVGLAVCAVLVALGLTQPKTYTATSFIYVEPMVARNLNEQGVPGFDQFRYGSFLDQQMQTIVRPDVLTAALRTLPAGTWRGPLESEQSAVARLAKALTVERALTSYQITVQLKASTPEAAAAIVNAVTKAYLARGREDEFKQADLREQILSEERARVKQELETDRKEQAALGASMGLASPADGAANPYDADLANLRTQLATARQARDVASAQLESVTGPDAEHQSGLSASAEELINTDPGLSAKKAAVNARRVVLESVMAGMTPANPAYRQAQDEIADLDRALEAKTVEVRAETERRIEDKLRTDLQRTADVESKLNEQLAQATAKATGAGPKLQRAAELANDIQRLTTRYTTIDEALSALEIETNGPGMAHVPLPATVPLTPDPSHAGLFFMAALPLGLVFGVSAAVIARMRDRCVYLGSDLQETVGFAPLAVLPAREDVSARVYGEYVLRLAAGVESAYRTTGAQSFVITAVSAGTDTGKLIGNLAQKLEEMRLRVIVVEASELLVTSHETLERQAATFASAEASGAAPHISQAGEGIASVKLERMKGQHGMILIDAEPLLHSAATEYAARCADATILVAESAVTESTELAAATELLSRLRVAGVGAVLDQVKLEQADEPFRSAVRVVEQRSLAGVAARRVQQEGGIAPKPPARSDAEAGAPDVAPAEIVRLMPHPPELSTQSVGSAVQSTPDGPGPMPMPEDTVITPRRERRSYRDRPGHVAASGQDALTPRQVSARSGVGQFAGLRDELAGNASLAAGARSMKDYAQPSGGETATALAEPQRSLDDAADNAAASEIVGEDDPAAVGRFVGESDAVGAVPSHTRSKIRLAFKEQEVNSKTTWFSKLFRGDPPANFRIVPEDDGSDEETTENRDQQWEQPRTRLAEPVVDGDAELSHLLKRIKSSAEKEVSPRPQPVSSVTPVAPEAEAPRPFLERRTEPRVIEPDEYGQDGAPAPLGEVPQPPAAESEGYPPATPAPMWFTAPEPPPALEPAPYVLAPVSAPPAATQAGEASHDDRRPLRPLTFQELAGEIQPQFQPEETSESEEPVPQIDAVGTHTALRSYFPAPAVVAEPAPLTRSFGQTGMSTWPAKEPMLRAYAPAYGPPEKTPTSKPIEAAAASATEASDAVVAAPVPTTRAVERAALRERRSESAVSSPSTRLRTFERTPILPNPLTDPVPVKRGYRLESVPAATERPEQLHPASQAYAPEPVPDASTDISFPPDQGIRHPMFGRRNTDTPGGGSETSGLTRRWKLLSQFEATGSDPLPPHRDGYTRATDSNASGRTGEG
jgi:uncharacterized protein involved in exopolysaccharide biosynthesis